LNVKLRVLFGEAAHFRDGAAYYYPSGYTAYYVDVRTLTEDDVNVHAVRKFLAETSPAGAFSVNRLLLWGPKGKVLRLRAE
jgi:hypothetical protein